MNKEINQIIEANIYTLSLQTIKRRSKLNEKGFLWWQEKEINKTENYSVSRPLPRWFRINEIVIKSAPVCSSVP